MDCHLRLYQNEQGDHYLIAAAGPPEFLAREAQMLAASPLARRVSPVWVVHGSDLTPTAKTDTHAAASSHD